MTTGTCNSSFTSRAGRLGQHFRVFKRGLAFHPPARCSDHALPLFACPRRSIHDGACWHRFLSPNVKTGGRPWGGDPAERSRAAGPRTAHCLHGAAPLTNVLRARVMLPRRLGRCGDAIRLP